ncbi:MAG: hypothetical protein ABFC96_14675, partial [Thermoguttaceae bacterium]
MNSLGMVLFILAVVIGIVTVVGHGIWSLLAMIFGGGRSAAGPTAVCVFCGKRTSASVPRCEWCAKELHNKLADELRDLQAVERQLRHWGADGRLPPKTVDNLLARVQAYRSELLHPVRAQVVSPVAAKPQPVMRPSAAPAQKPAVTPVVATTPAAVTPAKPIPQASVAASKPLPPAPAKLDGAVTPPATPREARRDAILHEVAKSVPRELPKPQPPAPPPEPRRSWSEMLAGFMEERNIRWGELIGGLLIVGPAIALVITFWNKLAANPYLQLTTFVAICSAVFGVGLYAHHRWKLRSTSLGLLIIAMLLVPLNFLAMAAVWKGDWGPGAVAADLVSLGIFTWLGALAGRVLAPRGRWLQVLAVVGCSAWVLVAARWVSAASPDWWYITAALIPVLLFSAAIGVYLAWTPVRKRLDAASVAALYTLLGTSLFATSVALGMMAVCAGSAAAALGRLAVPVGLAAVPIVACGLAVRRGVARNAALAAWHVSGTVVTLLGMAVMLAALGFAWPHPMAIMTVAAIDGLALLLAAFRWRLPALHAGAIACATLAYLTGFHMIYSGLHAMNSDAAAMFNALKSASSGTAIVGLFIAYAAVSEALVRWGRRRHAVVYAGGAGVMAALGLSLATAHGLAGGPDALRAAILSAIYGVGGLAFAPRWRRLELSYV